MGSLREMSYQRGASTKDFYVSHASSRSGLLIMKMTLGPRTSNELHVSHTGSLIGQALTILPSLSSHDSWSGWSLNNASISFDDFVRSKTDTHRDSESYQQSWNRSDSRHVNMTAACNTRTIKEPPLTHENYTQCDTVKRRLLDFPLDEELDRYGPGWAAAERTEGRNPAEAQAAKRMNATSTQTEMRIPALTKDKLHLRRPGEGSG